MTGRRAKRPGPARLLAAWLVAGQAAAATLVLEGGTVIDGSGGAPLRNGVVVIEGERITAVGPAGLVDVPAAAERISTEGMTVLPGLWDLQVHLMRLGHGDRARWNATYGPLAERVVMPLAARQLLEAGVTSARDVGAPLEAALNVRHRARNGFIRGPTLYIAGPQLRKQVAPGAEDWQWTVDGAPDARTKVGRLADAGVDYLLLADLDLWSAAELEAAIAEARARGLPVHAWAERPADVVRGVAHGMDGFVGTGMVGLPALPGDVVQMLNQRRLDPQARPLSWTPGISGLLNFESLRDNREPLDDPAATAALPPLVRSDILASLADPARVDWWEMPATQARGQCTRLRQLDEAKLRLVVGSDAGVPGHLHSRATWQEIDFWVRSCGLPVLRAIQAATRDAAVAMGAAHESGLLAPGLYADVIAVRGDVLRHPALLQSVDIVIRRGLRVR